MKPRSLAALLVFISALSMGVTIQDEETLPSPTPSPTPEPSPTPSPSHNYTVRLFNVDDRMWVVCNGQVLQPSAGYQQDVTINLMPCLRTGQVNRFQIIHRNGGGGYTWGYRILDNGRTAVTVLGRVAEDSCGNVGVQGCTTGANRQFRFRIE